MTSISETYDSQVIYKLGAIEAQVKSLGENLTAAVNRLEERITDSAAHNDIRMQEISARVERNEQRLNSLDDWKKTQMTRFSVLLALVSFAWLIFGAILQEKIGSLF